MSKFNTCTMHRLIAALVLTALASISLSLCEGLVQQQQRQHFRSFLPSPSSHQRLQNKNASTPPPPSPLSVVSSVVSNDNNKRSLVLGHYAAKNEDATPSPQGGRSLSLPRLFKRFLRMLTNALTLKDYMHLYRSFLWPGSQPDKSFTESLPSGELGCPFFGVGSNLMSQFKIKKGVDAADFDQPRFRFVYAFFSPFAMVIGKKNVKQIVNSEFDENGTEMATFSNNEMRLFGESGILYSKDKDEHSFLRRLVGNAMTPASMSQAVPRLQQIATEYIDNVLELSLSSSSSSSTSSQKSTIIGEDLFNNFTVAVAGKVILGLDLTKDEEISFKLELDNWISGILSYTTLLLPGLQFTKAWKAREFLIEIIEKKIKALKERGPDGSTLSAMVFATDDEHDDEGKGSRARRRQRALSHEQIIDNVLFLMFAGSDTSSSTLTNCLLFIGLHPRVWKKVVQEQDMLRKTHGEMLTKDQIDNECPYLEAVIKETMRIKPISGGQFRKTKTTMVVDGKQLPKGWYVTYNIRKTHLLDSSTWVEDGSHMDIMSGFKPERWLDGNTRPRGEDYMPFGSGPRYCLGKTLAMAEMKVFLAILARKLEFDLIGVDVENMEWKKEDFIAVPKDGLLISVRSSDRSKTE